MNGRGILGNRSCNTHCSRPAERMLVDSTGPQAFCLECFEAHVSEATRAARVLGYSVGVLEWELRICPDIPHPPHVGCERVVLEGEQWEQVLAWRRVDDPTPLQGCSYRARTF